MRIFLSALALVAAAFVLWGVGSAVRRLAKVPAGRWPVSIGIGLAAMVFVGGVLNVAHIAYRPVMWLVVVVALVVAALQARRAHFSAAQAILQDTAGRIELALAALAIAAMMLFTIATQLPPREFNFQDDLQKYFAHPVRMIETGTLAGSPLSALGSETLGGQAFLHGIVLSFLPIAYINGVDAVFALFALLMIAAAAGWRRSRWFPGAALGAVTIAIVNPQYVNVAGLYTGALLMATAVMLVADEQEDASPALLGVLYAALVAIKPTFGLFAVFHLPLSALAERTRLSNWKSAAMWALKAVAWATACIAPWIAMYLPTYLSHGTFAAKTSPIPVDTALVTLFSMNRVDGDRIASYTALAGLGLLVSAFALIAWWLGDKQSGEREKPLGLFAGGATGVACFLVVILYLSRWGGFEFCMRYSIPFLLGCCVISALMTPSLIGKLPWAACILAPTIATIAISASFVPGAILRYHQARQYGSIFAIASLVEEPRYAPYIQFSLSDAARQEVQKFQASVPAGEPIVAWIDTPYWLNYRRNRIFDVDTAGTATPWAHIPPGVEYYLWQYKGYAVRDLVWYAERMRLPGIGARERLIAARSYALGDLMTQMANHTQVVASDDQYVLFKVPKY